MRRRKNKAKRNYQRAKRRGTQSTSRGASSSRLKWRKFPSQWLAWAGRIHPKAWLPQKRKNSRKSARTSAKSKTFFDLRGIFPWIGERVSQAGSVGLRKAPSPPWLWVGLFSVWLAMISGVLSGDASPGVIQALSLKGLARSKQAELQRVHAQIALNRLEINQLTSDPEFQEKEIRRVLGYLAADELIFEFPEGWELK